MSDILKIIEKLEIPIKEEPLNNYWNTLNLKELISISNLNDKVESLSHEEKLLFISSVVDSNDEKDFEAYFLFFSPYRLLLDEILLNNLNK